MGEYTIQEILSQPEVWQKTLVYLNPESESVRDLGRVAGAGPWLFTGCGSSYYVSLAAAAAWGRITGCRASAISASDIMMYPECHAGGGQAGTVIAISRSGKTIETREAAARLKESFGWRAIALSSKAEGVVPAACDATLVLADAVEKSRFTTRVFTSTLLATLILAATKAGDSSLNQELLKLPDLAKGILERHSAQIKGMADAGEFDQYVFLGQGPYYGLAAEAMLKTKEMAGTPAEAYHSLEYLHGPRYAATPRTLITVLLSDAGLSWQLELLPKLKALGVQLAVICERASAEVSACTDTVFELGSGLSDYSRMLLVMPITQLFAYYRALALGKTVD